MEVCLKNSNILVTGASRGIGKAIATQLAASGARVAIHYNTGSEAAENLAKALGNQAQAFQANLSNPGEAVTLFERVTAAFDRVDVLVNNAGVSISSSPSKADQEWLEDWSTTLSLNLTASALLCKKAIGHFQTLGGGRIITLSSRAAFRGDTAEYMAYAASKGGLVALTRSIARAYGKQGIRAFDIAPGFVDTDMARQFMDQYGEDHALDNIALEKLTMPDDIAPMVAVLASGLSDHATGTTIHMNAGSYPH